ncbi:Nicotinamide-nucleotide amidohydrolase PncC [Rubripirellula amarantea]|uniref:Nicotinamide-nucleotide amidohydrolase PncC n=1 Tax=Rubripirellula amarantea TaxID=2527999 RepID=A0A5C5WJX3_9BACT|nr:nicotinamide-nucleotide amidohydrolase family protein [Rubripirellula amarantea]TWT50311.1 Nicotinamide-nucleotide amidohydrolase PncC [Rubripirellula amarantea]
MTAHPLCVELFEKLSDAGSRIVFAESCTGGLVAAEMAKIAGVSEVFCGSAVTYRNDTKVRWLGVDAETIANLSAVSPPVAHQMAKGVLQQTPEADLAVAITGHLGPDAPDGLDGLVLIGLARTIKGKVVVKVTEHHLESSSRTERQLEAMLVVVQSALDVL